MASKKKSLQNAQESLKTQEDWESFMGRSGLKIVDVYSKWCGPCTAIKDFFKKLKVDLSDDILHLGAISADEIADLERYRGTCQPQMLFYGGENGKNTLLGVVRGANAPAIGTLAKDLLAKEHDCIQNGTARVEFSDDVQPKAPVEARPKEDKTPEEPVPPAKTYTMVLVKPSVAAAEEGAEESLDEIYAAVAEAGLKVAADADIDFSTEENDGKLKQLFAAREADESFDALVDGCSAAGRSKLLVLSAVGDTDAVTLWTKLTAPPAENEGSVPDAADETPAGDGAEGGEDEQGAATTATEEDPGAVTKSVIADKYLDALVGSVSIEEATTQIKAMFPDFAQEAFADPSTNTEQTDEATTGEAGSAEGEATAQEEANDTEPTTEDAPDAAEGDEAASAAATEGSADTPAAPTEGEGDTATDAPEKSAE